MKIYIAHSKELNYIENLYQPIKNDIQLKNYEILLPHEKSISNYNTRDFYKTLSILIAEVSFPATGMGIELGWAYDDGIPIYCIYKKGTKISSSLKSVTSHFLEYQDDKELLKIIKDIIRREEK